MMPVPAAVAILHTSGLYCRDRPADTTRYRLTEAIIGQSPVDLLGVTELAARTPEELDRSMCRLAQASDRRCIGPDDRPVAALGARGLGLGLLWRRPLRVVQWGTVNGLWHGLLWARVRLSPSLGTIGVAVYQAPDWQAQHLRVSEASSVAALLARKRVRVLLGAFGALPWTPRPGGRWWDPDPHEEASAAQLTEWATEPLPPPPVFPADRSADRVLVSGWGWVDTAVAVATGVTQAMNLAGMSTPLGGVLPPTAGHWPRDRCGQRRPDRVLVAGDLRSRVREAWVWDTPLARRASRHLMAGAVIA